MFNYIPKFELKICYRESIKVSLVVGTILSLINQYEIIWVGIESTSQIVKLGMNYVVPFSVATYSRMKLLHEQYHSKKES